MFNIFAYLFTDFKFMKTNFILAKKRNKPFTEAGSLKHVAPLSLHCSGRRKAVILNGVHVLMALF